MKKIMDLMISENIRKYRRERNITQEQMAQAIGISPQSVSKWECGDGYPDITLLPRIANYFGITIDTLMGNDDTGPKEDFQRNIKEKSEEQDKEERLQRTIEYYRKYSNDFIVMRSLASQIAYNRRDRLDEYLPLLREVCERLLKDSGDSVMRIEAARYMCLVCEEDEVQYWLNADSRFLHKERGDILEERYRLLGDRDKYLNSHYANNLEAVIHLFGREVQNPYRTAEGSAMWQKLLLLMMESFGGGSLPDGWTYWYILTRLRLAAALCGSGETEQSLHELEELLPLVKQWYTIPYGTLLNLGLPTFFGEMKMKKEGFNKGEYHQIYAPDGSASFIIEKIENPNFDLYACLTKSDGWEWFDPVRNDPRFKAVVEQAKALNESEEKP
ncbi:MAG: helix-turn-helix domain-containing protein [Eubacteriales bacterium]